MLPLDPYQSVGARFLASNPVAYLADTMGLGKTPQWVRALDMVGAKAVTILCPSVLRYQLASEYARFTAVGMPVTIIEHRDDPVPPEGLLIVSYNMLDVPKTQRRLARRKVCALILEEAHRIKNPDGIRAKRVFLKSGLAYRADRLWFISGTPAQNGVWELYPFIASAGLFEGTYNQFIREHIKCRVDGFKELPVAARDPEAFRAMLSRLFLQRTMDVVGTGLDIDTVAIPGNMPDIDDPAYEYIKNALENDIWDFDEVPHLATALRAIGLAQLQGAADLIRYELENGQDKVLIGASSIDVVDGVCKALGEFNVLPINGTVTGRQKEANKEAFSFGDSRGLACNLTSASEGLNLTQANRVFFVQSSWNPEVDRQFIYRAYRRGQTRRVRASYLAIPNSLSTRVMETAANKAREINKVLG